MSDIERTLRRASTQGSEEAAARLAARAARAGLLDVGYDFVDTPFGAMLAAVTPRGLVRLAFRPEDPEDVLEHLAARVSRRVLRAPQAVDSLKRELERYFAGRLNRFETAVDWTLVHGFARKVLGATARIPYGRVLSYRDVARKAGNERAVRAAGNALGGNPIPIVVPCHRVVRTGGDVGGYGGGPDMKRALLKLEGALG